MLGKLGMSTQVPPEIDDGVLYADSLLGFACAVRPAKSSIVVMTDKEAVLEAVQGLPDDSSIEQIAEELQIMAAIRRGRADVAAGRIRTHEEAQRLLESWTAQWITK